MNIIITGHQGNRDTSCGNPKIECFEIQNARILDSRASAATSGDVFDAGIGAGELQARDGARESKNRVF